jgi:DNA-binding response OmpR family regulator
VNNQPESRALVIEDDRSIAEAMSFHLTKAGLRTRIAGDGLLGLRALKSEPPDVLIVDLMLPQVDGWFIVQEARRRFPDLPVIVVTARTGEHDRVEALALGADDVLAKPFSMRELVARVRRALDRREALAAAYTQQAPVRVGELVVDPDRMTASLAGDPIALTPLEFRLLWLLADNQGRALSREEIHRVVWGAERSHGDRSVDVLVRRLRGKIDEGSERCTHVQTLHGVGYRLEPIMRPGVDALPSDVDGSPPLAPS